MKTISKQTKSSTVGSLPGAAVYLRVSGEGQLGRDGSADGYSLPAQEEAARRKAEELGATVTKIYIERAQSAQTDQRPMLRQMLKELPDLGVDYLIVHRVDRFARNRVDDGLMFRDLRRWGITLVSATEPIDETPTGMMLHGVLATLAEYYSNNLSVEIKKGLYEKHRQGGTPYRPPLGYMAVRRLVGSQDMRSVEIDPERADLVRRAFTMYATGLWSLTGLTDYLEAEGLTSRPTPKRPAHPVGVSAIHRMLRNRYYLGEVTYRGQTVRGRHEPLVDAETFEQVQLLLAAARVSGDRPQVHEHYLAGSLFCAECGRRMVFSATTNRHGKTYHYYCCLGLKSRRRGGTCTTGYYRVEAIEAAIEKLYADLHLDEATQKAIRRELEEHLEREASVARSDVERHDRRIEEIKAKQAKLLELAYEDLISRDVLKEEQQRLRSAEQAATVLKQQLEYDTTILLERLETALEAHANPAQAYAVGGPLPRRVLNRSFFDRINVGPDLTDDQSVDSAELRPIPKALRAWKGQGLAAPARCGQAGRLPVLAPGVRPSSPFLHVNGTPARAGVSSSRARPLGVDFGDAFRHQCLVRRG